MVKTAKAPDYIQSLLMPNTKQPNGRRVWGVELETTWLPFLTATNTTGDTAISADALGCPIRLGYGKDGSVKFSPTGRPVTRVAKEISDTVNLIKLNFVANLQHFAEQVAESNTDGYASQIEQARVAGEPIRAYDQEKLDHAIKLQVAEDIRQAELDAIAALSQTEQPPSEQSPTEVRELVTA